MFSKSCRKSAFWTASVVAGAGLWMASGIAAADPATDASSNTKATPGSQVAQPAASTQATPPSAANTSSTDSSASSSSMSAPRFKVVCFHSSIRCFSSKTPPTPAMSSAAKAAALDLRAPELTQVFTPAQLSEKLQDPDEEQYDITETVQVEGERQLAPVSVGLMAIPWAIIHPTQAWRILMPVQDAK
jgi:hypothetical protein